MEDRVIIERIIEILTTPFNMDLSDGECLDEIIKVIETAYPIDWSRR